MKDMKKGLEDLGSCALRMLDYEQSLVLSRKGKGASHASHASHTLLEGKW